MCFVVCPAQKNCLWSSGTCPTFPLPQSHLGRVRALTLPQLIHSQARDLILVWSRSNRPILAVEFFLVTEPFYLVELYFSAWKITKSQRLGQPQRVTGNWEVIMALQVHLDNEKIKHTTLPKEGPGMWEPRRAPSVPQSPALVIPKALCFQKAHRKLPCLPNWYEWVSTATKEPCLK